MTYSRIPNRKLFKDHELSSEIGWDTFAKTIIIRQTIINQRQSISASFLNWYASNEKRESANAPCMHRAWRCNKSGNEFIFKTRSIVPAPDERTGWFPLKCRGVRERPRSNYLNTDGPARWRPAFNQRLHIVNAFHGSHSVRCHICLALLFFLEQEANRWCDHSTPRRLNHPRFPQSSNTTSAYSTSK